MRPISVLLTNNALGQRAGSETYIRDVALALLRRGHRPVAFSLVLGEVADELRLATIPVLDDLRRLGEPPDVIHGHHHLETLIAVMAFPDTAAVNFCHGWVPWEEMPLHHPAVRRYVAVDEVCVDRLVREEGIPSCRVELLLNFVDLQRFHARPPLPIRPSRAVVLSNAATADGYARAIGAACQAAGIAVDIVGRAAGTEWAAPESMLPAYDLVFAKGRTALEALAVGCATVLADGAGAGPLVTPDNYEVLRHRNFGIRELRHGHEVAWYAAQIAQYRAEEAALVSARVRAEAGMEPAIDRLLAVYGAAMAAPAGSGDPARAAAVHCCRIAQPLKRSYDLGVRAESLAIELQITRTDLGRRAETLATELRKARTDLGLRAETLETELQIARTDLEAQSRVAGRLAQSLGECEHDLASTRAEMQTLRKEVDAFKALPTLRLRDAVLKAPVVGPAIQAGARQVAKLLSG
jgi:hypothetical protein